MSERQRRDTGGVDLIASGPEHDGHGEGTSPWVWRIAGMLAVGLVAGVAGPHLLSNPAGRPSHSSSPGPSSLVAPTIAPIGPVAPPLRWAPRGPEVGSDLAAAALARMRAQRPAVDRLLWAGSLDGHDHVVVVIYRRQPNQSPTDALEVAAVRIGGAGDLSTADSQTIGYVREADGLLGLAWEGADQHTRLLVLSRPAPLEVQVSPIIDYNASGTISRRWQDAVLHNGVVVTDLGRRADPQIVVRPKDRGSSTSPALVLVQGRPKLPGARDVTVAGVASPAYAGPDASTLVASLAKAGGHAFRPARRRLHSAVERPVARRSKRLGRATRARSTRSGAICDPAGSPNHVADRVTIRAWSVAASARDHDE